MRAILPHLRVAVAELTSHNSRAALAALQNFLNRDPILSCLSTLIPLHFGPIA